MATSTFHPELRGAARLLPRRVVTERTLPLTRALTRISARLVKADVEVQAVGDVGVRVHRPDTGTGPHPALVWIHGGGFVLGNARMDDAMCRLFAQRVGAIVASVDYRLAPEHRFPTALHDCYAALEWLAARADVDAHRIAVGGGSAGGGLAAALALLARDRGVVHPVQQVLVYPMLDDRTAARTDLGDRPVRLWDNRSNTFGWTSYTGLAPGSDSIEPLAAPGRHPDLSGLPPAWIGVGSNDLFYDEDLEYAARLRNAGVECEVHIVDGAFHGFDSIRPKARVSQAFLDAQVNTLTRAFAR